MRPDPELERSSVQIVLKAATSHRESQPRLERRADAKLWLVDASGDVEVEVVRCFPWSDPDRFLSLRDGRARERAFVTDVRELDPSSRAALAASLRRSGFVLEVSRVLSIVEDFELRCFQVETRQGPRSFQTALDSWPRALEAGGLVFEDVYGDLYRMPPVAELDAVSRAHLSAFVDG